VTDESPWPFAGRVAGVVARTYGLADSYHSDHLASEMPAIVASANDMVASETGLVVPGRPDVVIVDRREWVERNLGSFSELIEPAEQRLADRIGVVDDDTARDLARRLMAAETGAMLGFLARRVLGQYELVVPSGGDADSIAFVGANVLQMERAQQFRPSEFRMWIALHEAAHRAQFVGVPWMRPYFMGLVKELVESSVPDERRFSRLVGELRSARREGRPMIDERGLLAVFATPGQREALDRVQALMSLLEGHGHVVMDRLGERLLPGQRRMSALLKARRADQKTALFFRLTGLEMKMRQYEMGERFVMAVERQAGWHALDAAWSGPEALPDLSEVEDPTRWLRRVG
jgi:coenzyme F420 biosynthesis associated uncharacterized protein